MSTPSKLVANRLATGRYLLSSARINTDAIARAVADEVPDLKLTEVRHVIQALAAYLARMSDAMEAAEGEYTREQSDDPKARKHRDLMAEALAGELAETREMLLGTFGPDATAFYGLRGTLPTRPETLLTTASNILRLLREQPAPTPRKPWMTLDLAALADELDTHVEALRTALDAISDEERELHLAKTARDAAVERWSRTYPGVGATFEGLYRVAGRADLAARIRPTQRRAEGHEAANGEEDDDDLEAEAETAETPATDPQPA